MNEFFTGLLAAVLALLPHQEVATGFNGYLEADYVYVAPISAGRINAVAVAEGDTVAAGELVFALDTTQQQNLLNAALARVAAAEATLENLETGSRGAELDVIRASLSKAEADLAQARSNLTRSERLAEAGTVPGVRVEQDRTALATAQAQVEQLRAQLAVAELPARSAQQVAAEANLRARRKPMPNEPGRSLRTAGSWHRCTALWTNYSIAWGRLQVRAVRWSHSCPRDRWRPGSSCRKCSGPAFPLARRCA